MRNYSQYLLPSLREIKPKEQKATAPYLLRSAISTALLALVAACGGGESDGSNVGAADTSAATGHATISAVLPVAAGDLPASRAEAARFLTQATFGPTPATIDRVMAIGYSNWLDEQFAKPQSSHLSYWNAANAAIKAAHPSQEGALPPQVLESFYKQALTGDDQVRQRVVYALSQIFVISLNDSRFYHYSQQVVSYLDLLGKNAFGNYRTLLEEVARHPAMGNYLSHMHNQKEDPALGRVPDENFAREVMQLFSIGLHQLNSDGTVKKDALGKPLETYNAEDIAGIARVFTGWSWSGSDTSEARFYDRKTARDPARLYTFMQNYPQYHSGSAKSFLGQTIPALTSANASLTAAMNALAAHPNVGPFIGKQLIQRMVTSNPSPAYVARVAQAFASNGAGARGELKAVIKAVLLDPEARDMTIANSPTYGKVREPVLRLTAYLRAFGATSDSGKFIIGITDEPGTQIGQTPLYSPSVFNFYRPGFVPPNTLASSAGMVAPEMQITNETSVAGYAEIMRLGMNLGFGQNGANWTEARRDMQVNYNAEIALVNNPGALVDHVWNKLTAGTISPALKTEIVAAVNSINLPALKANGSNQKVVDQQKEHRAHTAVFLALVSPEFIVQK